MASYLDKFKVKVGIDDSTKLDLSCQHITTQDFMKLSPVYFKEMVPGEKLVVSQQSFSRLAPMPVPTFGRANMYNRAFFVPYRTIFKGWNDFITDTVHVAGDGRSAINSMVPSFKMGSLVKTLFNGISVASSQQSVGTFGTILSDTIENFNIDSEGVITDSSNRIIDILLTDTDDVYSQAGITNAPTNFGNDNALGIILNEKGRQFVKILHSLGYQIVAEGSTEWYNYTMSAMPLLAYLKVYLDWYFPAQYYDDAVRTVLEAIINYDYGTAAVEVTDQNLLAMFELIWFVNYDSDYFVSAFDNPQGPNAGAFSSVQIPDITNNSTWTGSSNITMKGVALVNNQNVSTFNTNGTPELGILSSTSGAAISSGQMPRITQYALTALQKLTDYMKRHQLVGARAMDRYLARFGKNLAAEKLNRSLYIGKNMIPLQIGDIMSQADTSGASLGSYAGKGLAYGENRFEHSTDEYGMFLICNSIVPTVGYYQGIDRTVMHQSRLDFWTPEFDQLGNQAISAAELYVSPANILDSVNTGLTTQVFGFTPRYAEYKIGRDRLTGDFRVNHTSQSGDTSDAWHMLRKFNDSSFGGSASGVVHSRSFVVGDDANQYNRIFYNTDNTADHFYVIHNFDVVSWSPMSPLYDTYEFSDKGKEITADVNGVKVN